MDTLTITVMLLGILLALLASGAWIFVALIIASVASLYFMLDFPLTRIGSISRSVMMKSVSSWELAAVPLFVWMGEIINRTDVSRRLFRGLTPWVSRLPGGLFHSNVAGSVLFAAMSGSSVATTATIGRVNVRELERRGYDRRISIGSITVAGTIGIMIPPSITMIIFGLVAEVSVAQLFAAGLIPGLMLGLLYSGLIALRCWRDPALAPMIDRPEGLAAWLSSLKDLAPVVLLIIFVLGGIYAGFATPSEAAALGVLGAVLIAIGSGGIAWQDLYESAMSSVRITAMIGSAAAAAALFATTIGFLHLPQALSAQITALQLEPWLLLLLVTLIYLLLGAVLESIALILMTVPIVFPIMVAAGFDPVWFGIYLVLIVEIGLVTPPIGFNLFVMRGVTGLPIAEIARGALPFFFMMLVGVLLLYLVPQLALFLPELLYR